MTKTVVGGVAVLAFCAPVRGEVVATHLSWEEQPFHLTDQLDQVSVDLNDDGSIDFSLVKDTFVASLILPQTSRAVSLLFQPPDLGGRVTPIPSGNLIGLDSTFPLGGWHHPSENGGPEIDVLGLGVCTNIGCSGYMQFVNAYIGIEFTASDGLHYGWIHYNGYSSGDPFFILRVGGTIDSWAWETEPGRGIIAGEIPEPSSGFLIVSGAGFVASWRRRRKKVEPCPCA